MHRGLICAVLFLISSAGCGTRPVPPQSQVGSQTTDGELDFTADKWFKSSGPVGSSNGAELNDVRIHRGAVEDPAAPITARDYAEIDLLFPLKSQKTNSQLLDDVQHGRVAYTVHLNHLDQIEDDIGTDLLTPERKKHIAELRDPWPWQSHNLRTIENRQGPVIRIELDAPGREAKSLRRVKGVAEVRRLRMELLKFENIDAKIGKPLSHEMLGDFQITPIEIRLDNKWIKCKIRVSDPSRIGEWGPIKNGRGLRSESELGNFDEHVLERHFSGSSTTKGLSLGVFFGVIEESRDFEFQFDNIPLP